MKLTEIIRQMFINLFKKGKYYQTPEFDFSESWFKVYRKPEESYLENALENLPPAELIENRKVGLLIDNATQVSDIVKVKAVVKHIIDEEYVSNYHEANREGWNFDFTFHQTQLLLDTLLVCCRLCYPETGNMIYNVVGIKVKDGIWYIWDMRD